MREVGHVLPASVRFIWPWSQGGDAIVVVYGGCDSLLLKKGANDLLLLSVPLHGFSIVAPRGDW